MKRVILMICLVSAMVWLLVGCGIFSKNGGTISFQVVNTKTAISGASVGQNNPAGLLHMKYYIMSIALCKDLTTSGSGYSNMSGVLTIYTIPGGGDYDTYDSAAARADNDPDHYIDLMDNASLSKLASQVQLNSSEVGEYNYVVINWYRPIKVMAEVPINDGLSTILYTKDPVTLPVATPLTTSPAQEAVVELNNGGTWFKFQKPLVITQADIDNKVNFKVALTFDPDGIIQGATGWPNDLNANIRDGGGNNIYVPFLDVAAVAHREGEQVKREKYTLHYNSEGSIFDIRVALYYLADDPDKTIYGTEVKGLVNASSEHTALNLVNKVYFVRTEEDGTLSFLDWGSTAFISGFTRLNAVNDTDTASVIHSIENTSVSCNYTLDSIDDVSDIQ